MSSPLTPVKLFAEHVPLPCAACGRDVLAELSSDVSNRTFANVVLIEENRATPNAKVLDLYVCCKDPCDHEMKGRMRSPDTSDPWFGVDDLLIPVRYLLIWRTFARRCLANGYSEQAFDKMQELLFATAPFVMREMTDAEKYRFHELRELDSLGV